MSLNSVRETSLFQRNPDFNLGSTSLVSGSGRIGDRARGLVEFDVSSIPPGAIITSVEIQLYCTRIPDVDKTTPTASEFGFHRMLTDWGEGTGSSAAGSVAMVSEATWNNRFHNTTPWTSPGGEIGTDFATNPSSFTSVDQLGLYTWTSTQELIDDVQSWINNPSSNYGWMLLSNGENTISTGRRFATKEAPEGRQLPTLIINFAIPEPSTTTFIALTITSFTLRRKRHQRICQSNIESNSH